MRNYPVQLIKVDSAEANNHGYIYDEAFYSTITFQKSYSNIFNLV